MAAGEQCYTEVDFECENEIISVLLFLPPSFQEIHKLNSELDTSTRATLARLDRDAG